MADGNEIQAHAPDGTIHHFPAGTDPSVIDSTMKQYIVQGAAPQQQPGAIQRFKEGLRGSMGFAPQGGVSEDISQIGQGLKHEFTDPLDSIKLLLGGLVSSQQDVATQATKELQAPDLATKARGAVRWAESGIPMVGPMLSHAGDTFASGNIAGGLGEMTPLAGEPLMQRGIPAAGRAASRVGEALSDTGGSVQPTLQKYWGVGPELTRKAVEEQNVKVSDIQQQNQQALAAARGEHEAKLADITSQNTAAKKAAQDKYQAKAAEIQQSNAKAQQAYQERQQLQTDLDKHTADFVDHLPKLKDQAYQETQAKYAKVGVQGTVDPEELYGAFNDAVQSKLKGAGPTPAVIGRILNEIKPEDLLEQASVFGGGGKGARQALGGTVPMDEFIKNMEPGARDRFLRSIGANVERPTPAQAEVGAKEPLTFDRLHEHLSDLGAAASKSGVPDERAAMLAGRDVIDQAMRKLSDAEGKTEAFKDAQQTYKQYFNTFERTWKDSRGEASPIARALQSRDPVSGEMLPDRVADIVLGNKGKNYTLAKQLLDRYPAARTDILENLKTKTDRIAELPEQYNPKAMPTMETPKERPLPTFQRLSLQEMPEEIDPQQLKIKALQQSAEGLRSMKGIRGALDIGAIIHALSGNPLSLAFPIGRRLMSYGLESKPAMRYLTRPTPEDLAAVQGSNLRKIKAKQVSIRNQP